MTDQPAIADWLPHTPPMRMLTTIIQCTETHIQCSSQIAPDNPLLWQALFPCSGGIELFSQASGILFAQRNAAQTPSGFHRRPGAVVQVKSFELGDVEIPVGAHLIIESRYTGGTQDAAMFEGKVIFEQHRVFKGTVMIALFKD